jgi:hypothetical protein
MMQNAPSLVLFSLYRRVHNHNKNPPRGSVPKGGINTPSWQISMEPTSEEGMPNTLDGVTAKKLDKNLGGG